ncbi:hypothetical protein WOLCODRAFT_142591 [Wolfiporia cocos MD-104 SS10]|uniref:M-phase inducer phosphatase n=1 Tax=Wolfiporia cocos (strain MD-104) TaxID=742152 RepID=A0A2H3J977_WOLCO|nr:hypothetical protein WOLCODRAFT_142591 [Wolfiporia cocos MD-104 SS10]
MSHRYARPSQQQSIAKPFFAPSLPSRKVSQAPRKRSELDEFLTSDVDIDADLERSFASNMSLYSPKRDALDLASESEDMSYTPMDISPAPQRYSTLATGNIDKLPALGRPKDLAGNGRLFGKDMSNSGGRAKYTTGTSGANKRLQRATLPLEWTKGGKPEIVASQPQNIPPSPVASDAMDIDPDSSFIIVPSSSASEDGPLSTEPTITRFDFPNNNAFSSSPPGSPAPKASNLDDNIFYEPPSAPADSDNADLSDPYEEMNSEAEVSAALRIVDSPDMNKSRRSSREFQQFLEEEAALDFSPAPSSPMVHKLQRMASGPMLQKSILAGLDEPLQANKRPRRPALSMLLPTEDESSPRPLSALPLGLPSDKEKPLAPLRSRGSSLMQPVRRAVSAIIQPDQLQCSEADTSFELEGPDLSSPAPSYAKRQQGRVFTRREGTESLRPLSGASMLLARDVRDGDLKKRGPRRSDESEYRGNRVERDTPRSKYLSAAPGLGGFGDNEAHGKVLPCHRVKEDGLMRVTSQTIDNLLDGIYDDKLTSFYIIDCRFDYEYSGGHIPGAININTTAGVEDFFLGPNALKPTPSISSDSGRKTVVIFHCEFSVKRAPTFAKHLRSRDRASNNHVYPRLHYPEVYILEGGYSNYYKNSAARCQPRGYVQMDDPHYATSRKEDLDHFRKGKFGRTKSYAYGDGKLGPGLSQPKRNTAPSGSASTLFAAGNVTRSRRGTIVASSLRMVPEDGGSTQFSEDEDVDLGDSPCPPPSKVAMFRGKRLGRLSRAETFDSSRMALKF